MRHTATAQAGVALLGSAMLLCGCGGGPAPAAVPQQQPPRITWVAGHGTAHIEVRVDDADGDAVQLHATGPTGLVIDRPARSVTGGTGTETFDLSTTRAFEFSGMLTIEIGDAAAPTADTRQIPFTVPPLVVELPDDPPVTPHPPVVYSPFTAELEPASFALGGSTGKLKLSYREFDETQAEWTVEPGQELIELEVRVEDAVDLRAMYLRLGFDTEHLYYIGAWNKGTVTAGWFLGDENWQPLLPPIRMTGPYGLEMAGDDYVVIPNLLLHPEAHAGFSGDGLLLKVYFAKTTEGRLTELPPATVTDNPESAAQAELGGDNVLRWRYSHFGDFNQSGLCDRYDLSAYVAHLGEARGAPDSLLSFICAPDSATVDNEALLRLTIGYNEGLDGYRVYTGSAAEYVTGGSVLGEVPLTAALGDPATEVLRFEYALPAPPTSGQSFWVAPVYKGEVGIRGNLVTVP